MNASDINVLDKHGQTVQFNLMKIVRAAWAALMNAGYTRESADKTAEDVSVAVLDRVKKFAETNTLISYEVIHTYVEDALMDVNKNAARSYIEYRNTRKANKRKLEGIMDTVEAISRETNKDNANTLLSPASKMAQIAETVNKYYALEQVLPKPIAEAHKRGQIYIHDLGFYKITYNCLAFSASKVLDNMKMPHGYLRKPNRVGTAFALAAIALQSAANSQFGGISLGSCDTELSKYVKDTDTYEDVYQACEGFIGNLNTLHARSTPARL